MSFSFEVLWSVGNLCSSEKEKVEAEGLDGSIGES